MVMVKSRRVGGQTYQVPVEVRPDERTARSIRWLIRFARERLSERWPSQQFIAASEEGAPSECVTMCTAWQVNKALLITGYKKGYRWHVNFHLNEPVTSMSLPH